MQTGEVANELVLVVQTAQCPRCGYDQRGPVSTWKESCPVQGTCSECGVVFYWGEAILPDKFEPRWCVEFVERRRSIPLASVSTFLRSFWPWTFWSRIKMSQLIRARRLLLYVLILWSPLLLGYVGGQTAMALVARHRIQRSHTTWVEEQALIVVDCDDQIHSNEVAIAIQFMSEEKREQTLASIRDSPRLRATVKRREVERLARFDPSGLDRNIGWITARKTEAQDRLKSPPSLNHSYRDAIVEMIFLPLASSSRGTVTQPGGKVTQYPGPSEVVKSMFSRSTKIISTSSSQTPVIQGVYGAMAALGMTLFLPLMFIMLPASRRRTRVRWQHIGRIALYSQFMFATLLLVMAGAVFVRLSTNSAMAQSLIDVAPLLFWIALPMWWAVAIKRYLKMPHAIVMAVVLGFIATLLLVAVAWCLDLPVFYQRI